MPANVTMFCDQYILHNYVHVKSSTDIIYRVFVLFLNEFIVDTPDVSFVFWKACVNWSNSPDGSIDMYVFCLWLWLLTLILYKKHITASSNYNMRTTGWSWRVSSWITCTIEHVQYGNIISDFPQMANSSNIPHYYSIWKETNTLTSISSWCVQVTQ